MFKGDYFVSATLHVEVVMSFSLFIYLLVCQDFAIEQSNRQYRFLA